MSYPDPRDPRDPRTAHYEHGYDPNAQAYSQMNPYPGDPYQQPPPESRERHGPDINPTMFIGGVVMTGVVTGLAAWLVAWVLRTIVEKVNEAGKFGVWNPMARDEIWFGVVGFLCALAAAALWYVLQLVTPSPDQFYRWIVGLLITASVLVPLLLSAEFSVGIATAIVHLVIGLPILTLIPAMGHKSIRQR